MDHLNVYTALMEKARGRFVLSSYGYHLHHIVPRSMGGPDTPENLVLLTHKEHMLAHTLLAHVYPNQWFACELIGLRTLRKLPRWKRKQIGWHREYLKREANRLRWLKL